MCSISFRRENPWSSREERGLSSRPSAKSASLSLNCWQWRSRDFDLGEKLRIGREGRDKIVSVLGKASLRRSHSGGEVSTTQRLRNNSEIQGSEIRDLFQ